jgi:hypothetical protein
MTRNNYLKNSFFTFQGYLKLALIVCILATFNPFPFMGIDTPSPFAWALENKVKL